MSTLTVSVHTRWWLKPWLWIALTFHWTTSWRPSEEQIESVASRATYFKVIK